MDEHDETTALHVLGWIVGDQRRAERMLDVTGLSVDGLRAAAADPAQLGAILDFLLDYEPDLLRCADELELRPEQIVAARERLRA